MLQLLRCMRSGLQVSSSWQLPASQAAACQLEHRRCGCTEQSILKLKAVARSLKAVAHTPFSAGAGLRQ